MLSASRTSDLCMGARDRTSDHAVRISFCIARVVVICTAAATSVRIVREFPQAAAGTLDAPTSWHAGTRIMDLASRFSLHSLRRTRANQRRIGPLAERMAASARREGFARAASPASLRDPAIAERQDASCIRLPLLLRAVPLAVHGRPAWRRNRARRSQAAAGD
jgi:hypothetical protein